MTEPVINHYLVDYILGLVHTHEDPEPPSTSGAPAPDHDGLVELTVTANNIHNFLPEDYTTEVFTEPLIEIANGFIVVGLPNNRKITGLVNSGVFKSLWLVNDSDFILTLRHDHNSSDEENRFMLPNNVDYDMVPNTTVILYYAPTKQRWYVI